MAEQEHSMKPPTKATLNKYGLSADDWMDLYYSQHGLCPICEENLDTRICVDHYHVRNYKKMAPDLRRKYVRGLVHWFCNHYYLGKGITVRRAYNTAKYLERFEKKLDEI